MMLLCYWGYRNEEKLTNSLNQIPTFFFFGKEEDQHCNLTCNSKHQDTNVKKYRKNETNKKLNKNPAINFITSFLMIVN